MQNNLKFTVVCAVVVFFSVINANAYADDIIDEKIVITETFSDSDDGAENGEMESVSADAVSNYKVDGSLFEQITNLEQEKVLMQLEKERAQLDLDLDRLAAEKIKLHMEIDNLSDKAEQQQLEIEAAHAKLEAEVAALEREKAALAARTNEIKNTDNSQHKYTNTTEAQDEEKSTIVFSDKYKLVNVIGAGNQLQATIIDLVSGQKRKIGVGKILDGYTVKSISLDDGVVFINAENNDIQSLNVGGKRD